MSNTKDKINVLFEHLLPTIYIINLLLHTCNMSNVIHESHDHFRSLFNCVNKIITDQVYQLQVNIATPSPGTFSHGCLYLELGILVMSQQENKENILVVSVIWLPFFSLFHSLREAKNLQPFFAKTKKNTKEILSIKIVKVTFAITNFSIFWLVKISRQGFFHILLFLKVEYRILGLFTRPSILPSLEFNPHFNLVFGNLTL